jgi:hypothetical protein
MGVGLENDDGQRVLAVHGKNLALGGSDDRTRETVFGDALSAGRGPEFPMAVLDDEPVRVLAAAETSLRLAVPPGKLHDAPAVLKVALDPYAVITMEIKP